MVGHMYGSRIRPPDTSLGKVKNGCRRNFTTTPVPMFGLRTPQILTPWIIMYVALLRKTPIAMLVQKASLIDRIKVVFETLPRETETSACSMFWTRIETVIDVNGGYFGLNF